MKKNTKVKTPMTVKLCGTLLKSMYRDADKKMWICETFKGTSVILPEMPTNELHQKIRDINYAEGTYFKAPTDIKTTPRQLGFAFEEARS